MEDFVPFGLAVKLEGKGFSCEYPFAMYDKDGDLYPLFTSCDEDENSKCIFGNRMYYDYDDFIGDKDAMIAPTISQVLKWLRKDKGIYISIFVDDDSDTPVTYEIHKDSECVCTHQGEYFALKDWSKCELKAIEYVLDNLI